MTGSEMKAGSDAVRGWLTLALLAIALAPLAYNQWHTLAEARASRAEVARQVSLGRAALEGGDARRAVVAFQRAADLDGTSVPVRNGLLDAQAALVAEAPEAASTGAAALEHELSARAGTAAAGPSDAVALGNLARTRGDAPGARRHFERALESRPDDARALLRLGELSRAAGRLDEAGDLLKRAVAAAPDQWRAQWQLGEVLRAQDKHQGAVDALRRAVELERNVATHAALGAALIRLQSFKDAIEHLEEARRLAGNVPGALPASLPGELGLAYFRTGAHDRAVELLADAAQRTGDITTWFNLGVARQALGQHTESIRIFEAVLRKEPALADAHTLLVRSLFVQGQLDRAEAAIARYRTLAAKVPAVASAADVIGQLELAIQQARKKQ